MLIQNLKNRNRKNMHILLSMKKQNQRTKATSIVLLGIMEIQVICLLFEPAVSLLYSRIAELFLMFTSSEADSTFRSILITTIFVCHLSFVLLLAISFGLKGYIWASGLINFLAYIIQLYRYLLFLPCILVNLSLFHENPQSEIYLQIMASFNIIMSLSLSLFENYSNWSNRFMEKDYCNKRNGSLIEFFLYTAFIVLCILLDNIYASFSLLIYCCYRLYGIIKFVQYQLIQYLTIFFSFYHIYMVILYLTWFIENTDPLSFQQTSYSIMIGICIVVICTNSFTYYINTQCLCKGSVKFENSILDDRSGSDEVNEIDNAQQILSEAINKIVILSRIILSKIKLVEVQQKHRSPEVFTEHFDHWWSEFDQIILMHRAKCTNKVCICHTKESSDTADTKIFIQYMIRQLSQMQSINSKESKFKLINICLYIQLAKKPLKGFYELIRMQKEKQGISISVDLNCLTKQARQCFDTIFIQNDVLNQDLPLLKMIEFEEKIQKTETELKNSVQMAINFLDMFTFPSIKMSQIEADSNKLFEKKAEIDHLLEELVISSQENSHVNLLVFLFYRYIQFYRSRESEFRMIENEKLMKKRFFHKTEVNIFSPEYGAIYIDLIEERGKIKKLSQNVCDLYGYSKQDMVSFNINQFMPSIFGRYHARFLSNFIEKGKIKILKQKERILFAKNKKKFIMPLQARLKTEHLFDNEFGASALVKKMETDSNFVIIGKKGKIEQITQQIYKKLFHSTIKEETAKVSKLCICKMIPALMGQYLNDFERSLNKVHETLWIYFKREDLFDKFRYTREPIKGGKSVSCSVESSSFIDHQAALNGESVKRKIFQKQYFTDLFKPFLSEIDILSLSAVRISYKLSKLSTEEFQLMLLEVLSVSEIAEDPVEIYKGIINQYKMAADFLQIYEEEGTVEKNMKKALQFLERQDANKVLKMQSMKMSQDDSNTGKKRKKTQKKTLIKSKKQLDCGEYESVQFQQYTESVNFFDENEGKKLENIRGNSEQSSIVDNTENQSKKQILINAFNSKDVGLSFKVLFGLNFLLVLMFIFLAGFVGRSIGFLDQSMDYINDNNFLLKLEQTFEYRMALLQLGQFYVHVGDNIVPQSSRQEVIKHKRELEQHLSYMVQNINKLTITKGKFSSIYTRRVSVYNPILRRNIEKPLLQLMSQWLSMFPDENGRYNIQTLRLNYQIIHNMFDEYDLQEIKNILDDHEQIELQNLILFIIYECIVVVISVIFLPLLVHYKEKETFILNLLSYMSLKELKKAKGKLKILWESLKVHKNGGQIQQELIRNEVDEGGEIESHYNRSIKLIRQQNQHVLKQLHIYILLCLFIFLFSILSVTTFIFCHINYELFAQIVNINHYTYKFTNRPPVLVNTYMSNINQVLRNAPMFHFRTELYEEANTEYYDLIDLLSDEHYHEIEIIQHQYQKLMKKICNHISCSNKVNKTLLNIILELKTEFVMWEPKKDSLPEIDVEGINTWLNETDAIDSLGWFHELYKYSNQTEKVFYEQYSTNIQQTKSILIIMTIILFPLYIVLIIFIEHRLINLLSGILKNAESVYMHFPVSVLIENTYLTSYFNEKIKQSK